MKGDKIKIDIDGQIKAVEREISMRKRVYPKWIQNSNFTKKGAEKEIASMMAVLNSLKFIKSMVEPTLGFDDRCGYPGVVRQEIEIDVEL